MSEEEKEIEASVIEVQGQLEVESSSTQHIQPSSVSTDAIPLISPERWAILPDEAREMLKDPERLIHEVTMLRSALVSARAKLEEASIQRRRLWLQVVDLGGTPAFAAPKDVPQQAIVLVPPAVTEEQKWNQKVKELKEYVEMFGNGHVPPEIELGKWVIQMRKERKEGRLSEKRRRLLDASGFEWIPPKDKAPGSDVISQQKRQRQCSICQSVSTPAWRNIINEQGERVVACNKCAMRSRKGIKNKRVKRVENDIFVQKKGTSNVDEMVESKAYDTGLGGFGDLEEMNELEDEVALFGDDSVALELDADRAALEDIGDDLDQGWFE